jgi:predicted Rdx family selenoprotein
MTTGKQYVCNPDVVLREEDDSGTLLFNPDTGDVLVINCTGRFIWDLCRGGAGLDEIIDGVRESFDDLSPEMREEVGSYVSILTAGGFLGSR